MNPIYSHLYLDLQHKTIDSVNLKQYDYESRYILCHITDNGNPYHLLPDTQAEIKIHKPDDTKIVNFANVDYDSNHITVEITSQMTAMYGILHADITLFQEGMVISTMPFLLNIERSPVQDEDVISSNEYGVLEDLITEIQSNENQRQVNEESRKEAENIRNINEETRQYNENIRVENESTRKEAEANREDNENIRIENEKNRITNEGIRQKQETDREEKTSMVIKDAQNATQATISVTTDLQNKLDNHHFVLTQDKDIANGVPSLDVDCKIPIEELYDASTISKGIVQLTNSISSSSTTAATPNSVKTVYDALTVEKNRLSNVENKSSATIRSEITKSNVTDALGYIPYTPKEVDNKVANHIHDDRYYTESEINNFLSKKADQNHTHNYATAGHTHDDRYYTESEVNNLLSGKANSNHPHTKSDVGLGNVDNTSDMDKPVSKAQQEAINALNTSIAVIVPDNVQAYVDAHKTELRGATGPQGPKGDTGATGPQGPSGSPWGGGTFTGDVHMDYGHGYFVGNAGVYSHSNQQLKLTASSEEAYQVFLGVHENRWTFCPNTSGNNSGNGAILLGHPHCRWGQVYSTVSAISTSDRNRKKDISSISDKYLDFFGLLQPVTYRFIDGASGRIHVGFISQDVEAAMTQVGLSDLDFAGFCKDKKQKEIITKRTRPAVDANGNATTEEYEEITWENELDANGNPIYTYSLRYEEFIALNTAVIQHLQTRINRLEQRLERLEHICNNVI